MLPTVSTTITVVFVRCYVFLEFNKKIFLYAWKTRKKHIVKAQEIEIISAENAAIMNRRKVNKSIRRRINKGVILVLSVWFFSAKNNVGRQCSQNKSSTFLSVVRCIYWSIDRIHLWVRSIWVLWGLRGERVKQMAAMSEVSRDPRHMNHVALGQEVYCVHFPSSKVCSSQK